MRLFAAVLPPAPAVAELAVITEELRQLPGAERLRWTEPESWHFTLAFMGEVPDDVVPALCERLARAAHRTETFGLGLGGGGRFGDRALWVGADGHAEELRRLAARSVAAGRRAGLRMAGNHRFTPHLTLARSRRGGLNLRPYVEQLEGFVGTPWTVDVLSLVRSHLPESGVPGEKPRYVEVERWPLRAAE
ncbi:RNA 2',3'-cyclic phosphodiesterase [Streptomyces sp. NPDC002851]